VLHIQLHRGKLVTLVAGKWCCLLFTGEDDKVFMTRSLNIMQRQQKSIYLYTVVNLKPKQVIVKDCGRGTVLLKLTNDRHEASRGLSETAQLLVVSHSGSAWADHTIFRKTVQN